MPICDCLAENQSGGDLATVGDAMVEAATELNAEARANPGGAANLRARLPAGRGPARAPSGTGGIHAELIRRLGRRRPLQPRQTAPARRLPRRPTSAASTPGTRGAELNTLSTTTTRSMEATTLTEQLWGGETTKAVDNFPVSGERVPVPVVRWLGRLKAAAARGQRRAGRARRRPRGADRRRGRGGRAPASTTTSSRSTSSRPAPAPPRT